MTKKCQLIINYIIYKTYQYNLDKEFSEQILMSVNRIQRLLYLIQLEYMHHFNKPIIEDDFTAWPTGPAIGKVYYDNQNRDSYFYNLLFNNQELELLSKTLDKKEIKTIDNILEYTNTIDTLDLSKIVCSVNELWTINFNPNSELLSETISKQSMLEHCNNSRVDEVVKAISKFKDGEQPKKRKSIRDKFIGRRKRTNLTDECKAVINYIIEKTNEYNSDKALNDKRRDLLSINKINRILFLFQVCYIDKYGKPAFEDEFYAWTDGPAMLNVHCEYGYESGSSKLRLAPTNSVISDEMKEIIDELLVYTRRISTKKLTEIVTRFKLWYSVYDPTDPLHNQVISNDKILESCQNCDEQQISKKPLVKTKNIF